MGTYDQFREIFRGMGVTNQFSNVFSASMVSGKKKNVFNARNCFVLELEIEQTNVGKKDYNFVHISRTLFSLVSMQTSIL